MIKAGFSNNNLDNINRVLLLGAHCDDIEIGCGGTILKLLEDKPDLSIRWVVLSSSEIRAKEARASAESFLEKAGSKEILIKSFRNGFFPYVGDQIKEYFEELKKAIDPDLIFTHYRDDLHQDHRITSELTWNTFRSHFILEYEIPKYDGDLGSPNFFVELNQGERDKKVHILMESFATQANKQWFTEDTFKALIRLRGIESDADSGYAEAYYCRKIVY